MLCYSILMLFFFILNYPNELLGALHTLSSLIKTLNMNLDLITMAFWSQRSFGQGSNYKLDIFTELQKEINQLDLLYAYIWYSLSLRQAISPILTRQFGHRNRLGQNSLDFIRNDILIFLIRELLKWIRRILTVLACVCIVTGVSVAWWLRAVGLQFADTA